MVRVEFMIIHNHLVLQNYTICSTEKVSLNKPPPQSKETEELYPLSSGI
jgi:hypothetical protein